MREYSIQWYIISTGYEDRLVIDTEDDDSITYFSYKEQCQYIEELDFDIGEYIIIGNSNNHALKFEVYYNDDNKEYDFDTIDISDLPTEIIEYLDDEYDGETGLVLSSKIPNKIPWCAAFGITDTILYKDANPGHFASRLLKLIYDAESG